MGLLKLGAGAAAGALVSRKLTQMVLQDKNTGALGYTGNLVATLALAWASFRWLDQDLGVGVAAGGVGSLVLRIYQEQVSKTSAAALSGLGDLDFSDDGLGEYIAVAGQLPPQYGGPIAVLPTNLPGAAAPNMAPAKFGGKFA